jgi:hypothetical protein
MPELLTCPACHRLLQVPDELLGQTVHCPDCKQPFEARRSSGVTAGPATPPAESRPVRRHWDDTEDDFDDVADRLRRDRLPANRGALVLALGIISLVLFGTCLVPLVLGPVCWVMGSRDLAAIRAGTMQREGEGMVQAGRILGIVGFVLGLLLLAAYCLYFLLIALFLAAAGANAPPNRRR